MARQKIAAGNWKMNGTKASLAELSAIAAATTSDDDVILCPPATLISNAVDACSDSAITIGAQNLHAAPSGAYTGEISAAMLTDIGATHVIIGHSERREYFGESDSDIAEKAKAAHDAGLIAIICVGETLEEREAGKAISVVGTQLKGSIPEGANAQNTIIAYEPVWAIGTGKVPTNSDIAEIHTYMRSVIPDAEQMRVLYGGSVKGSNASEIFAIDNVDGGLVGGASLKAADFIPIIEATRT